MRKSLIFLIGILSFIGINTVKADTVVERNGIYIASDIYSSFDNIIENYNSHQEQINHLKDYWNNNHSSDFKYYFIIGRYGENSLGSLVFNIYLYSSTSPYIIYKDNYFVIQDSSFIASGDNPGYIDSYSYTCSSSCEYSYSNLFTSSQFLSYGSSFILDSNVVPIFKTISYGFTQSGIIYKENYSGIKFPSFQSSIFDFSISEIEITDNENFPTLKSLLDGTYSVISSNNYVEINLNNYSYVALSLKDYNTIPENNYSTYSNIYVKGQLCITPVYNYGMTERKDILTGTQVQGCSEYYDDFTLSRMYILKNDVENHAIYYLKAYDTSKDNIIKIDTSIFNISYITEDNKDNPQVNINGKIYPTLSYGSLTDTSTKSEDEGYVSGVSCAVGDFNCYKDYNSENFFDDIFSSPLEFLKKISSLLIALLTFPFTLISAFPTELQVILYSCLTISLIIGLIRLIK